MRSLLQGKGKCQVKQVQTTWVLETMREMVRFHSSCDRELLTCVKYRNTMTKCIFEELIQAIG